MKYIFAFLPLIFSCLCARAQYVIPQGTPVVNGYDITYTNPDLNGTTLYLCGNYGDKLIVIDSAVIKKGAVAFRNKKTVFPCGVYTLCKSPQDHFFSNWTNFITVVLNKSNQVQISQEDCFSYHHSKGLKVTGSEETALLNQLLYRIGNSMATVDPDSLKPLCQEFCEMMPQSFLSKYVQARFGWLTEHDTRMLTCQDAFRDIPYTDFSEPRLLYSSLPLFWIYKKIADCDIYDSNILIQKTDSFLRRCTNDLTRNYFVKQFFQLFDNHNPDQDPVLIHLYDNYDRSWIEEGSERRYERKIETLRKIVPGAQIPELISHNIDGQAHSSNDIQRKYTVLWFWDSDCDHCKEITPILHQMYQEHSDDWDFEVFAIEVNEDFERWKAFSDSQGLWDWINLSMSRGESNIDFIEYFDIVTTPEMFLIDNSQNHTIKARQLSLEELRDILGGNN